MKLEFTPTQDDYVKAVRSFSINKHEQTWWIIIFLLAPMLIFHLGSSFVRDTLYLFAFRLILGFFMLGIPAYFYSLIYTTAKRMGAQAKENPKMTMPVTWAIEAEQLCFTNPYGETKSPWETFSQAAEDEEYYYLSYATNKNMFQFIPKRSLSGRPDDENTLRGIFQARFANIQSLKVGSGYKISLYLTGALYALAAVSFLYSLLRMGLR